MRGPAESRPPLSPRRELQPPCGPSGVTSLRRLPPHLRADPATGGRGTCGKNRRKEKTTPTIDPTVKVTVTITEVPAVIAALTVSECVPPLAS